MNTITAPDLARGDLDIDPLALPVGVGVGALRATAAHALIRNWSELTRSNMISVIRNHRTEFLGEAGDAFELLDANLDRDIPAEAQTALQEYLRDRHTIDELDDALAEFYTDALIIRVETFLTAQVLRLTGHDPDTVEGRRELENYAPRVA